MPRVLHHFEMPTAADKSALKGSLGFQVSLPESCHMMPVQFGLCAEADSTYLYSLVSGSASSSSFDVQPSVL